MKARIKKLSLQTKGKRLPNWYFTSHVKCEGKVFSDMQCPKQFTFNASFLRNLLKDFSKKEEGHRGPYTREQKDSWHCEGKNQDDTCTANLESNQSRLKWFSKL